MKDYTQIPRSKTRLHNSGFSLVEMLTVISIIAILMTLLLPALGRARHLANRVVCASNLRSIGQANKVYSNQYKGSYPPIDIGEWPMGGIGYNVAAPSPLFGSPWGPALLYNTGFLPNPAVYYCTESGIFGNPSAVSTLYKTPVGSTNFSQVFISYCYYVGRPEGAANFNGSGGVTASQTTGYVTNPTTHVVYNDNYLEPLHPFAQTPISDPGTIVAADVLVSQNGNWFFNAGVDNGGQNGGGGAIIPWSNHVTSSIGAPDGGNDLYNDGSVSWLALPYLKCRYTYPVSLQMNFWQ